MKDCVVAVFLPFLSGYGAIFAAAVLEFTHFILAQSKGPV